MRSIAHTLFAALTVLTACATGEASTPGFEGSPDLTRITVGPAPTELNLPTSEPALTDDSAGTTAENDAAPPTTDDTTAETTVVTADVAIEVTEESSAAEATCATLRTAGYESRKAVLVALDDIGRAAVEDRCDDDIQRLQDAMAIEERATAINDNDRAVDVTDLSCGPTSFTVTVTNNMADHVGVHANFVLTEEGSDVPLTSGTEPIVIWSLAPGDSETISGEYVEVAESGKLRCNFGVHAFDATGTEADASLGVTTNLDLTGTDPAVWFPKLLAYELETVQSDDSDRASVTEDLRSTSYGLVLETVTPDATVFDLPTKLVVCASTITRPDNDHISFVYYAERPDGNELRHGLFRRGADNQWRWLGVARYVDTPALYNCGRPTPGH